MSTTLLNDFACPPAAFRGKPFWAWNAKLDAAELRRQIRVFKEMGFGGFFMHSRLGLATPYLSDEWFDMIKASVDEAEKGGLEAWIYDEDRYPSGAAGGLATRKQEYRRRILRMTRYAQADFQWPSQSENVTHVFAVTFKDDSVISYEKLDGPDSVDNLPSEAEILTFVPLTMPGIPWFNNCAYLDTMNPDAVAEFIKITHEAYKSHVGDHFAKTIPGVFTDEPNPGPVFREWFDNDKGDRSMAWTGKLPESFERMFGYDLTDHLPEVVFDIVGEPISRARYHYHLCKSQLFVDAFANQIGQWCEDNNLLLTGHTLLEEPASETLTVGAVTMPFYSHMQVPGIDVLTEFEQIYITAKQCVSVARQTARKWVLSELYGGTGWDASFEMYKYVGDWQAALGITLRCPHLSFYSMAGEAKRDYPASIHYHVPWWRQYHYLEDYFSRLNVVMTAGQPVCELAVINPSESYYVVFNKGWQSNAALKGMEDQYTELAQWLLGGHLDFDFADEQLLTEFSTAVGSDNRGVFLQIGEMSYRAVLVPSLVTIRQTTVDLLKRFVEAGGLVVFAGEKPRFVDALPGELPEELDESTAVAFDQQSVVESLQNVVRSVSIRDPNGEESTDVVYQLRRIDDGWALLMVNTNRQEARRQLEVDVRISFSNVRQLQFWDAFTGKTYELAGAIDGGGARFTLGLEPSGSALIVATANKQELGPCKIPGEDVSEILLDNPDWEYQLDDHNVFVLDHPDCVAESQDCEVFRREQKEIVWLDRELRDHFGVEKRGGQMVQPWVSEQKPPGPNADITLTYKINIETVPDQAVLLAVEQARRWEIHLNGHPVDSSNPNGWWVDQAIETLEIAENLFQAGENILTLTGRFEQSSNLEIVYLLGQFGVLVDGSSARMTALPNRLTVGNWVEQGLAFYSGNVTYTGGVELTLNPDSEYMLRLGDYAATVVKARVNNHEPVIIGMGTGQQEITALLKNGYNTVELKLFGSRRNAFGPLHITEDKPVVVGSHSFQHDKVGWQEAYRLVKHGLLGVPMIVETGSAAR